MKIKLGLWLSKIDPGEGLILIVLVRLLPKSPSRVGLIVFAVLLLIKQSSYPSHQHDQVTLSEGDWAQNRIIPDLIRALKINRTPKIRNPYANRPWQHVLDPLMVISSL